MNLMELPMVAIHRSTSADTIEVNKRKQIVRAIWSSDHGDAHRTAFNMRGIDTSRFDLNPQIDWAHGKDPVRGEMPVGLGMDYGCDRHQGRDVFVGSVRFWDDDEFTRKLFARYASGELRAWSIFAIPVEASAPTRAERSARPDWGAVDLVYRTLKLTAVSAVAVGSNPHALTLSVERSAPAPTAPPISPERARRLLAEARAEGEARAGRLEHAVRSALGRARR